LKPSMRLRMVAPPGPMILPIADCDGGRVRDM
jgi:hypothetical protein